MDEFGGAPPMSDGAVSGQEHRRRCACQRGTLGLGQFVDGDTALPCGQPVQVDPAHSRPLCLAQLAPGGHRVAEVTDPGGGEPQGEIRRQRSGFGGIVGRSTPGRRVRRISLHGSQVMPRRADRAASGAGKPAALAPVVDDVAVAVAVARVVRPVHGHSLHADAESMLGKGLPGLVPAGSTLRGPKKPTLPQLATKLDPTS